MIVWMAISYLFSFNEFIIVVYRRLGLAGESVDGLLFKITAGKRLRADTSSFVSGTKIVYSILSSAHFYQLIYYDYCIRTIITVSISMGSYD